MSTDNKHQACPTHCCPVHGCKYAHDDCPVVLGTVKPVYPNNNGCEACEPHIDGYPLWSGLPPPPTDTDALVRDLRETTFDEPEYAFTLLTKAADTIERLTQELAVCRDAIEVCYDVCDASLPSDSDSDAAVRRTTMRRLAEAIGKASPRLLMERQEGQKLYGLRWREQADTIERLTRERDEAVARERERCAQLCEDMRSEPSPYQGELEYRVDDKAYEVAQECARAIRATKD